MPKAQASNLAQTKLLLESSDFLMMKGIARDQFFIYSNYVFNVYINRLIQIKSMPPRKNKKQQQQDDEMDKKESNSKWAKILDKQIDEDEEADVNSKKRQVFNFDFSKQHRIYNQKEVQKKIEPKIQLTPQQKQQLAKRQKKKEEELKIKKMKDDEKKQRRKKQKSQQNQKQKQKRQQQQKLKDELQLKLKSKQNSDGTKICYFLLFCLIFMMFMQYQRQIYSKISKFRIEQQQNYYQVLETDSGVTNIELKAKYRKLVLKYHPDKNPNCESCLEKFNQIMKAWQILGNPQKRQSYDQHSGVITQIKSNSVTLTKDNYGLLEDSQTLWIVQVYDSTDEGCHYFGQFWQEAIERYKPNINFGRIDVWHQSNMISYLPYNFQVFPGLYSMHRGSANLCQVDLNRPLKSIDVCIQSHFTSAGVTKIKEQSEIVEDGKLSVILGANIKIMNRIKMIQMKYQKYFNFYQSTQQNNLFKIKESNLTFRLKSNHKNQYQNYQNFLQSHIKQTKSMCQLFYECEDKPCLILLEQYMPQPGKFKSTIVQVKQKDEFGIMIDDLKNRTDLNQKFDVGLYQSGKIDFGYVNEIQDLSPDNGEYIDFKCQKKSIFAKLISLFF